MTDQNSAITNHYQADKQKNCAFMTMFALAGARSYVLRERGRGPGIEAIMKREPFSFRARMASIAVLAAAIAA